MAEPVISRNRVRTTQGTIRDLELNISDIVSRGFEGVDLVKFKPRSIINQDPKRGNIGDLPSCYIFVEAMFPDVKTIGAGTGNQQTIEEIYMVTIQYISSPIDSNESLNTIKQAGYFLYDWLIENLNVNDICSGATSITDLDFTPEYFSYQKKWEALDNFIIRLNVQNVRRKITARR
jgi:hypothetical protein